MRSLVMLFSICLMLFFVSCKERTGRTGQAGSNVQESGNRESGMEASGRSADSSGKTILNDKPISNPALEQALQGSCLKGELETVNTLIGQGVNVNAGDAEGRTALMYAGFNGHTEVVRKLINSGAIVDYKDQGGRTALLYASTGPFAETVRLLLESGADPNVVDVDEHFTPIMHAAAEGQLEVVRVLLEYGADPALRDVDGETAFMFAVQGGHTEVANLVRPK